MKKYHPFFVFAFFVLAHFSQGLAATGDVCCVMSKVSQDSVDTQATQKNPADCKSGGQDGDFKVCTSFADENNLCPDYTKEKQCQACGYFWVGSTCLKEDPVKKAKEQLEKEEKAKKEKEKKK